MKKRKTHPVVRVLSLLIPISLIFLFLLLRDIAGFRIGSDTDYGAVCVTRYQGETLYSWYVFREDGTVREWDITEAEPYIWQEGNRISVMLQEHDGNGKDWDSDMFFQNAYYVNYYLDTDEITRGAFEPPSISSRLKRKSFRAVPIESGSEYVTVYQLSNEPIPLYYWKVWDSDDEELWYDYSMTPPVVSEQSAVQWDGEISVTYTTHDSTSESLRLFCPETYDISCEYHVERIPQDNRRILIAQATQSFNFQYLEYDSEIARTENFVNTEESPEFRQESVPLDTVMHRAEQEVSIPYTLVLFRYDFSIRGDNVISNYWEATFSNAKGQLQTVYLDGTGKTVLLLDGRPYT